MLKDPNYDTSRDKENIASDISAMLKLSGTLCDTPASNLHLLVSDDATIREIFAAQAIYIEDATPFCKYSYENDSNLFIVLDATKDERFRDLPSVKNGEFCFYAGVRLENSEGEVIGVLHVTDTKPRKLSKRQKEGLELLGEHLSIRLEEHRNTILLHQLKTELQNRNKRLRDFGGIISHDMKMPLANTILTCDFMRSKYKDVLDADGLEYLNRMKRSSLKLSEYITNIFQHYQSDQIIAMEVESFFVRELLEDSIDLLNIQDICDINLPEEDFQITGNKAALRQVLLNLFTNSLKYNDKEKIVIDITYKKQGDFIHFSFKDNGIGISEEELPSVFTLFKTFGKIDRNGNVGNGIGLSTVQKLIVSLGGNISVESVLGESTTFNFYIKHS